MNVEMISIGAIPGEPPSYAKRRRGRRSDWQTFAEVPATKKVAPANLTRRNPTKGQSAMLTAMMYPEGGRGIPSMPNSPKLGVSVESDCAKPARYARTRAKWPNRRACSWPRRFFCERGFHSRGLGKKNGNAASITGRTKYLTILPSGPFNTTTFPPGPESNVRFSASGCTWIGAEPICARMAARRSVGAVAACCCRPGTPALRRLAGKSCASDALPANPAEFRNSSPRVLASPKTSGSSLSAFQIWITRA
jgi:hypothetical protein